MLVDAHNDSQRWFARSEARPHAEVLLFCLPYAGSGAAAYRPWLAHTPPELELRLIQLPGREARLRERPFTRMEPLIEALGPAIEAELDRPYVLFGHSMGALVAFELARALRRRGAPTPLALLVSGRRAPQLPDLDPPLHQLTDGRFVGAIMRRYNGIPKVILEDIELLRLFLPTLRADLELIETYTYSDQAALACPIVAFGGESDQRVGRADLLAWRSQTEQGFQMRQLPGDHFYLQSERAALIAEIMAALKPDMEQR